MIRQTQSYLAGAVSATALIAAAVVAFVLLVSLQALKDWPLAGIGGSGDSAAVSEGRPAVPGGAKSAIPAGAAGAPAPGAAANGKTSRRGAAGAAGEQVSGDLAGSGSPSPSADLPASDAPTSTPTGGGGSAGSAPSTSSNLGGGSGGGAGSQPGASGSGGGSGQSTSGPVADTVNNTVSGVDKTLGGTGVTKVTEEVVNGAAGPESTVGKTVDKAVETVGGLLGGNR